MFKAHSVSNLILLSKLMLCLFVYDSNMYLLWEASLYKSHKVSLHVEFSVRPTRSGYRVFELPLVTATDCSLFTSSEQEPEILILLASCKIRKKYSTLEAQHPSWHCMMWKEQNMETNCIIFTGKPYFSTQVQSRRNALLMTCYCLKTAQSSGFIFTHQLI